MHSHTPGHIQVFKNSGFSPWTILGLFTTLRASFTAHPPHKDFDMTGQDGWTTASLFYQNWLTTTSHNVIKFKSPGFYFCNSKSFQREQAANKHKGDKKTTTKTGRRSTWKSTARFPVLTAAFPCWRTWLPAGPSFSSLPPSQASLPQQQQKPSVWRLERRRGEMNDEDKEGVWGNRHRTWGNVAAPRQVLKIWNGVSSPAREARTPGIICLHS